jgi:hypothetical protein
MGGKRVRAFLAIIGGSAVTTAVAATVVTSAPESPIDVCALMPTNPACIPAAVRQHEPVQTTNPPSITQVWRPAGS